MATGANARLAALADLARTLATGPSLDRLLTVLHERIGAALSPDIFFVALCDERSAQLELLHYVVDGRPQPRRRAPIDLAGEAIARRRPVLLRQPIATPPSDSAPHESSRSVHSLLFAPVLGRDRVLGVVSAQSYRPDAFCDDDLQFLAGVAALTGTAIEDGRRHARMREQLATLADFYRISTRLGAHLDEDAILGSVCEELARRFRYAHASVYRLEGRTLRMAAQVGYEDWFEEVPIEQGIIGRVARTGRPELVPAVRDDPDYLEADPAVTSEACVPLLHEGSVIGVLNVESVEPEPLTPFDLHLLEALADQIVNLLENARLHQAVSAERAKLAAIVEQMADGVAILGPQGELLHLNAAAERILGRPAGSTPSEAGGMEPFQLRRPDGTLYRAEELPGWHALREGRTMTNVELQVVMPSGELRDLASSAAPLRDLNGQLLGAVVVVRDVTEMRSVERLKDEFMAIASHELRTPLTIIKAQTQLVARKLPPGAEGAAERLKVVLAETDRMARLIQALLDVSRLEKGELALTMAPLDLVELTRAMVERLAPTSAQHVLQFEGPEEPVPVVGDRDRLEQVLLNLLENAVRYSPDGGPVTVTLRIEGDEAVLAVRDAGIGLSPEALQRVFERFYQVDGVPLTRRFPGMGLGLYLSQAIVARHGGRIWAESPGLGQGSTFSFTLPIARGAS